MAPGPGAVRDRARPAGVRPQAAGAPAAQATTSAPAAVSLAVLIERQCRPNAWEDWRFTVADVAVDDGGFGDAPRLLRDDGRVATTLHPGFELRLYRDEAEGYYLNLSSGAPVWFVMWRIDEDDPSVARPVAVTLSYNEAGRWLDAQERVDSVPLPSALRRWLQDYTDAHYRPEPRQRRRPASFLAPDQR
jgi:hypothetical protein